MKLSHDSDTLEDFLDNYHLKSFHLTESNAAFLKKVYDMLFIANKQPMSNIKEFFPSSSVDNSVLFDDSLKHLNDDIKIGYNKRFDFEFKIGARKFFLHMFFPNAAIKTQCVAQCKKHLKFIYCWFFVANTIAQTDYAKELTLAITFSHHKKRKPDKDNTFDSVHVNTAYTYACREKTNISIFRKEEWFKVLIHETFHSMGMDFVCMDNSHIESQISKLFPVKQRDIRVYETYCEMWAEILNVLFISFFATRSKENYKLMTQKMNSMLVNEAHFSLFQMKKVLQHYDMTYIDLLENRKVYKENTYVLSYYVLKGIMMSFLNTFIEWCVENNGSICFKRTDSNLRAFGALIESLYKHPIFLKNIEQIQRMKSKDDFVNNTMRMSLYEMG